MSELTNQPRTAIVSGAVGGIGREICFALASDGYTVVVADIREDLCHSLVAELPTPAGQIHAPFSGDLTKSKVNDELAKLANGIAPIGCLVNAIGISPKNDGQKILFTDIEDELWERVLRVNLTAPFYLMRAAAKLMPTDGTASIVNLLSIAARTGTGAAHDASFGPFLPSAAVYGVSKAGLHNLTVSLAFELADRNIRVNGVSPGYVQTEMLGAVTVDPKLLNTVPMQRFALPHEVASIVSFLASPKASYVNGSNYEVNGGWASC